MTPTAAATIANPAAILTDLAFAPWIMFDAPFVFQ
jgi:hypothetical protein